MVSKVGLSKVWLNIKQYYIYYIWLVYAQQECNFRLKCFVPIFSKKISDVIFRANENTMSFGDYTKYGLALKL